MSEKEEISIKVNICDRFYPLRIESSEEEAVRKSVKSINERVKFYTVNYSVQDKQDALAMVALEYASDSGNGTTSSMDTDAIEQTLSHIESLFLDI